MEYTGERIIPKLMNPKNGMLIEHIARYEFAKSFCKGRVLDIACGNGYGSGILLKDNPNINELVGIDIDRESINYAKEHYNFDKTSYFVDNAFNENLHEIYGTLIISTPFGHGKNYPCSSPFHVYQYTEEEFKEVLKPFSQLTMYHQIDTTIEIPKENLKYYLMVAVCKK